MPFCGTINDFGIDARMYLHLIWYERETGNVLPFEMVVDYFSQEFEPDGSPRLYNNGNHPEVEAFVNWMWEEDPYPYVCNRLDERHGNWECRQRGADSFWGPGPQNHRWCEFWALDFRIWYVGQTYIRNQRQFNREQRQLYGHEIELDEFVHPHFFQLSPQMLRAFARAEADPNYPLDLTGLQRAGY